MCANAHGVAVKGYKDERARETKAYDWWIDTTGGKGLVGEAFSGVIGSLY